ncbi:PAS domain S-box protein [Nostoc flagelliforme FACHB-838]|uniref:histidine kinase n=1 Tax=Nostoc flagelliforme FACHB-838 TaxID=2692904 RepID=A0ABR8DXH3_9NOSO|nr:PAS domain S-box protein [Nostoc flagelliforme]MBD2534066.1 PAS domain S-box protein [Nostoc flagelliforme FACHB-838]
MKYHLQNHSILSQKGLSQNSSGALTEAHVLMPGALMERPTRQADLEAENQALRTLSQQLMDKPQSLLRTLVQIAKDLCQADTVGVSLLETLPNGNSVFRWVAISGALESLEQTTTPANFSPCGTTLRCGCPQLYARPERYFTYLHHPQFPIVEGLLFPLCVNSQPLGSIWILSHHEQRQFDREDQRLMTSLAAFTAAALQSIALRQTAQQAPRWEQEIRRQQKQAQTSLRQSEAFNQQILDSSDDCIKVLDLSGRLLYMNQRGQALIGIQEMTPFLNASWVEFWQDADQLAALDALDMAKAGKVGSFQGYCPTLAGEPKWWDVKLTPIRGAGGQVERLLCISRDITERRRIEEERHQNQERLRQSEERLSAIYSQAAVGLCEISLEGHFQQVNDGLCKMLGRSREEMLSASILDVTHPDDVLKSLQALEQLVETDQPVSFDKRYLRPDGTIVWANSSLTRLDNEQGCSYTVLAVTVDLNERKRAEEVSRCAAELDAFRVSLTDALRPLADPVDVQATASRVLGEYLGVNRVAYFEVRGANYVVERDYVNGVDALAGCYPIDSFGPKLLAAYRTGGAVSVSNVQADPNLSPEQHFAYAAIQIGAYIGIPLLKGGEFVAGLAVHASKARTWMPDELALTEEVAERTWAAVERARAESALRQSEQRFRLMADAVPQIIWTTDAKGRVEFFNKQWSKYTGVPYEPTTAAQVAANFVHPEDSDRTMEALNEARRSGGIFSVEHRIRSAAGTYRWFLVRAEPYRDQQTGEIVRWFGTSVDIHEHKRMEANLGFLAEIMADFAPLKTADEIMQTACARTAAYFNLSRCLLVKINDAMDEAEVVYDFGANDLPSLVGTYPLTDFHTEDEVQELAAGRVIVINNVATVPRTSEAGDRFARLQIGALVNASYISDGQWKFVLSAMQTKPRVWCNDEIELLQELSARVWLRIERACAEAVVAADLRDMQRLRELSAWLVSEGDIQTLYQEIVSAAISLTRADAGSIQALDESTQELVLIATQGIDQTVTDHFQRVSTNSITSCGVVLATGKRTFVDFDVPESEDLDGSLRLHLNTGLISAQSTPLISRSGRQIGMVSTHWRKHHRPSERELRFLDLLARQAADLIEQRQTSAEREQLLAREQAARAEADRVNRIKDEFLAVLSHELRSPLNPILGWSTLLLGKKLDEAKTAQALATIQRNAKLQSELIEDLLDVSRILRGKLSFNVAVVNLVSIIQAGIETVRLAAEAKSIQVEASLAPDVGLVSGDATRLQQVIWNLLLNAVKFTPNGGRVNIRLSSLDSHAQITVSDTGQGIEPDFLPYVFDHFRQANATTTRKFGGLGLGLAIVRHLVELHGGTVGVESLGVGMGATFTIRLPLMSTQATANQNGRSSESPSDLNGIQVLVVDDELDSREFVAFVLEQAGADVITATTANEALIMLIKSKPDVLLSDIGMPDSDGYILMQKVRALPPEHGGQVRAIALTAYAGDFNQQQALSAGFQQHLSKPVEPEVLVTAIASLLSQTKR